MLALCFALVSQQAKAQLQLPGAFAPAPEGATSTPGDIKPKKRGPPPPAKVPNDDAIAGRTVKQNGRVGLIEFRKDGKELKVARLTLAGENTSRAGENCELEVTGAPFSLIADGKPVGANRYRLDLEACPLLIDVLEGAVMVSLPARVCTFEAAQCRVDPNGLWGQPASEIGPERTKEIERSRGRVEQGMRSHFRDWVSAASKDHALVTRIAREQAGFSSRREEICRDYARETEHGYCGLVVTEARSLALTARVAPPEIPEDDNPKQRKKR